jgi:hypothetical protein
MKWRMSAALLTLILTPSLSVGLEMSSVHPESASAGESVTIIGKPFTPSTRVVIGGHEVVPRLVDERQLVFIVPQLNAGNYALYLLAGQQTSGQTISLNISLPSPQINSLKPSNIDECFTEEERIVTLNGNHFRKGSKLLLDRNVVPSTRTSETEMRFTVPSLKAGTYGVQVINLDGSESLPHSLWLNNIPHIYDVSVGEDYISSYQLVINGKNFVHNSSLIAYEYPVGLPDLPPQQQIIPGQGSTSFRDDQSRRKLSESVTYIDCNTLIYNRYPYSRQDKKLVLRVGNPDGKQTEAFEILTP